MFPSSPTNGQQVIIAGVKYRYSSSTTSWDVDRVLDSGEVTSVNGSNLVRTNSLPIAEAYTSSITNTVVLNTSTSGVASPANPLSGDAFDSIASIVSWLNNNSQKFLLGVNITVLMSNFVHDVSTPICLDIPWISSITFKGNLDTYSFPSVVNSNFASTTLANLTATKANITSGLSLAANRSAIRFTNTGRLFTGIEGGSFTDRGLIKRIRFENVEFRRDVSSNPTTEGFISCSGFAQCEIKDCLGFDLTGKYLVSCGPRCSEVLINNSLFLNTNLISSDSSPVKINNTVCLESGIRVVSAAGSNVQIKNSLLGFATAGSICVFNGCQVDILNCHLRYGSVHAINSSGGTAGRLVNSTINLSAGGLTCSGGSWGLSGCVIDGCTQCGLRMHGGSFTVLSSTISNCQWQANPTSAGGLYLSASFAVLSGCSFSNNTPKLFHAVSGSGVAISGSTGPSVGNITTSAASSAGILTNYI